MEDYFKKMNYVKGSRLAVIIVLATVIVAGSVLGPAVRPVRGDAQRGFHFVDTAVIGSTDLVIMDGSGHFDVADGEVSGGGSFTHIDITATTTPLPIKASGTWHAEKVMSYSEVGTYGSFAAGTLMISIVLVLPDGTTIPATLKVVCNISPAGLDTGTKEGITLSVHGDTFTPGPVGTTVFDVLAED